jgi:hypothetical protein
MSRKGAWSIDGLNSEVAILRRMWRAGATVEAISAQLPGRDAWAVKQMVRRLGLPAREVRNGFHSKELRR